MCKWTKCALALLLALLLFAGAACALAPETDESVLVEDGVALTNETMVELGQWYSSPEEVALYLHAFGALPGNYLTKREARELGWVPSAGNLWDVAPGMSIGGDAFGNREGLLPAADGRQYFECDVNYDPAIEHGRRGPERIVFSSDGLVYYSASHYQEFELLWDGWYEKDFVYAADDGEGASR